MTDRDGVFWRCFQLSVNKSHFCWKNVYERTRTWAMPMQELGKIELQDSSGVKTGKFYHFTQQYIDG